MRKTVIITGGGGSIGKETAKLFAENNYDCIIVDINEDNAKFTLDELKDGYHDIYVLDISKTKDIKLLIKETIKKYKKIDTLINLAASNRKSFSVNDNIEERWDKTIENDLKSVYMLSEACVVEMQKNKGGSIVNIGSIAGGFLGSHTLPYSAAKAGIIAITKSHARIYGIHNIRVNCIVPGIIDSNMAKDSVAEKETNYFSAIREITPLKRWGEPKEIAEAIFFVGSDKCKFMTGSIIIIDGGATLTLGNRLDEFPPFKWEKWPPKEK